MKPKSELMAKLRKKRAAAGLLELRLWLTPAQKERVLKYVARLGLTTEPVSSRYCAATQRERTPNVIKCQPRAARNETSSW